MFVLREVCVLQGSVAGVQYLCLHFQAEFKQTGSFTEAGIYFHGLQDVAGCAAFFSMP